jgi:hypothetical protein
VPGKQRATLLILAALAAVAAIVLIPMLTDEDELQEDTPTPAQTATTITPGATSTTAERRPPPRSAVKTIAVRDGKPVGGVERLSYDSGETVNFVVTSNAADEVHVHGYDIEQALPAGERARVRFKATLEGIYEVELHGSGEQIAELRVSP